MQIREQVLAAISEELDIQTTDTSQTFISLGADSLDYVAMIMKLEEEFNVEISDDEAEKVNTVEDAILLMEKKLA